MRILWVADHPEVKSGYGVQSKFYLQMLAELGHEVVILARGGIDQWTHAYTNNQKVVPRLGHPYGYDIIRRRMEIEKCDLCITLHDLTAASVDKMEGVPWAAIIPVDAEPAPVPTVTVAKSIDYPIAMTKFGQKELKEFGIEADYLPHVAGADYTIHDRDDARSKVLSGLPDDAFLVGVLAANQSGAHNRKGLVEALIGFGRWRFEREMDNAYVYVHTQVQPVRNDALDLRPLVKAVGLDDHIIEADPVRLMAGEYTPENMKYLFNSFDVLLAPSHMEGFNVPLIEAHGCGVPAIMGNYQGPRDLFTPFDYAIEKEDTEPYWNPHLQTFLQKPHISAIIDCLDRAHEGVLGPESRKRLASNVAKYRYDPVKARLKKILDRIEKDLKEST